MTAPVPSPPTLAQIVAERDRHADAAMRWKLRAIQAEARSTKARAEALTEAAEAIADWADPTEFTAAERFGLYEAARIVTRLRDAQPVATPADFEIVERER